MRRFIPFFIGSLALTLVAAACGDDESSTSSSSGGEGGAGASSSGGSTIATNGIPCEIDLILEEKCQICHSADPQFGAPMPLVTRDDFLANALDGETSVGVECLNRMLADQDKMPPANSPQPTNHELDHFKTWIDNGMLEVNDGDDCGHGGAGGMGGGSVDCTPDLTLTAAAPFEMPSTSDDEQVCFGVEIDMPADKRHITAIMPQIDNTKIIHHILLLTSPTPVSPEPESCGFTNPDWKLLYAWGPGTPATALPPAAGFPYGGNEDTHFVLQVHYNNLLGLEGEMDQSGVQLCTTSDLREHDADVMAFGSISFPGLEPNKESTLDCDTTIQSGFGLPLPITVYQSWPHMHQLGRAQYADIQHPGGGSTPLVDVPNYDFEHQILYDTPATLDAGDVVNVQCTWDNDTGQTVNFGEGTADEMCFTFLSYYPRIEASLWSWLLPASISSCEMSSN